MNSQIKKWAKDLNKQLTREMMYRGQISIIKAAQQHLSLGNYKFQKWHYHYTTITMAKVGKLSTPNTSEAAVQQKPFFLSVGMLNVQSLWKIIWQTLIKLKYSYYKRSSNCISWYWLNITKNLRSHKHPHTNVPSSFIHDCQKSEGTKMSFSRWIDNGILFYPKRK
jgi:hypothetical protein